MADKYNGDEALEPEAVENKETEEKTDENPRIKGGKLDHSEVMKQYDRAWTRDRHNIERMYVDAAFLAGDQWHEELRKQRDADSRPTLTFNRMGQFVRQVTGEIRQNRPAVKVVAVDDGADEKIADLRGGMIRYIENRSDAKYVYATGADSQVACGMGAWEVFSEYADDTTFEQELGLRTIDDQIGIMWDPDARHPTRKDAMFVFVPTSLTRQAYEDNYPDKPIDGMPRQDIAGSWYQDDSIQIARYWYKEKFQRQLMRMPDGHVEDTTGMEADDIADLKQQGGEPYEREGHKVKWVMMNGADFLTEPKDWPGRYFPIVPVIGEEIAVGNRIERHGIVRFAADAQRSYNYARSTQTEYTGLQPKAPYLGTEDNFKDYAAEWDTMNTKNFPYLLYKPDGKNGGIAPQRQNPPTTSPGLSEAAELAGQDMQAIVGIYNASLGAASSEDSGRAIQARESQGDTGTFVYMTNFALSVVQTGRILNDLIPHYYDTSRTIQILNIDGSTQNVKINQQQGVQQQNPDGTITQMIQTANDVTSGAYEVQMELGPSYATKREEARDGMTDFVKAFPEAGPLIADKVAKAMDWPDSDDIADRLQTLLPPPIQAEIRAKAGLPPLPPPPPSPQQQAEGAKAQAEVAKAGAHVHGAQSDIALKNSDVQMKQMDVMLKQLQVEQQKIDNVTAELNMMKAQMSLQQGGQPIDGEKLHKFVNETNMVMSALAQHVAGQVTDGVPGLKEAIQAQVNPPDDDDDLPSGQSSGNDQ